MNLLEYWELEKCIKEKSNTNLLLEAFNNLELNNNSFHWTVDRKKLKRDTIKTLLELGLTEAISRYIPVDREILQILYEEDIRKDPMLEEHLSRCYLNTDDVVLKTLLLKALEKQIK